MKKIKANFQEIHYLRQKPSFALDNVLKIAEFFYGCAINIKNFLYDIHILQEKKCGVKVICVGNLTTGGVGKTPIVISLANEISKTKRCAIISRGYGAKISNKKPTVIKDNKSIKFKNGLLCADEPYQIAKKVNNNVIVITCANRKKAIDYAIIKYGIEVAILDDGFSNRKVKKDKTILAIDSKMRFGNNHLLPRGPLREPISQIKRADEIILVDKEDNEINEAIEWVKKYNKETKICKMKPKRVYNIQTKAEVLKRTKAIAFCAIGQPKQFFNFAKKYYELVDEVAFNDHYEYTKADIQELIIKAKKKGVNTFITTQKDETKLFDITKEISNFSFNVLELEISIEEV